MNKLKKGRKRLVFASIIAVLVLVFSLLGLVFAGFFDSAPKLDDGSRERGIIESLLAGGYRFVLPRDYFAGVRYEKTALMLHDADFALTGASTFLAIEREYGIRSAFYPRPDTDWFSQNVRNFKVIESQGWEIGFQYDCLSRAGGNRSLAMEMFRGQLAYMRALFNVSTTDYHGDSYNLDILNLDLYNETAWAEMGLSEVYSLEGYSYFTDTDNRLVSPVSLGSLVVVMLHTDWTKSSSPS